MKTQKIQKFVSKVRHALGPFNFLLNAFLGTIFIFLLILIIKAMGVLPPTFSFHLTSWFFIFLVLVVADLLITYLIAQKSEF